MKKCFLCSVLSLLLLLTLTANAASAPGPSPSKEQAPLEVYSLDWFIAMEDTYWRQARELYGSYHTQLDFFSSCGCDDVCCTNPDHFHWCPSICEDPGHFHSEAEYRSAGAKNAPPCPCHSTPASLPGAEDGYWQTIEEDWLSGSFRALPFAG